MLELSYSGVQRGRVVDGSTGQNAPTARPQLLARMRGVMRGVKTTQIFHRGAQKTYLRNRLHSRSQLTHTSHYITARPY